MRSVVFPALLSTIAVGVVFKSMMHPTLGLINKTLEALNIPGIDWLGNPHIALLSVALVDVWKGVGIATVIFIAGIMAIPSEYYEALKNRWRKFISGICPFSTPIVKTCYEYSYYSSAYWWITYI
ncbi:hypothetical protein GCM10020331_060960 [Ectobacillus funiculus]